MRRETPTLKFGVFTQAFNSNPTNDFDTRYGVDSYTVQVPNITATSTTPQSAGGGAFTPAVKRRRRPVQVVRAMVPHPSTQGRVPG